jgi:hypothetical protein
MKVTEVKQIVIKGRVKTQILSFDQTMCIFSTAYSSIRLFLLLFEMGSYYTVQVGFKRVDSSSLSRS